MTADGDRQVMRFCENIDHSMQRLGPAHVALVLDYVFGRSAADALLKERPDLCTALYGEDTTASVIGGNVMRLAWSVWQ